jgi:hypothetical protein
VAGDRRGIVSPAATASASENNSARLIVGKLSWEVSSPSLRSRELGRGSDSLRSQKAAPTATTSFSARLFAGASGDEYRSVCWVRAWILSKSRSESCDLRDMVLVVGGQRAG